jgi:hypothetical protein
MMFDVKYIWFTFQLNPYNYQDIILHKTMRFFYFQHEHSCMSLKKIVSSIWIFKILNRYKYWTNFNTTWNSCDFCMNLCKSNFANNLYKLMKLGKFMMVAYMMGTFGLCSHVVMVNHIWHI